ncbi:hypothetical protein Q1695_000458 [Nippostrongylus brasiliensis]|nr:hypothetical protein Q1695_000458 [Nippostrongylus brasiliensis]
MWRAQQATLMFGRSAAAAAAVCRRRGDRLRPASRTRAYRRHSTPLRIHYAQRGNVVRDYATSRRGDASRVHLAPPLIVVYCTLAVMWEASWRVELLHSAACELISEKLLSTRKISSSPKQCISTIT